MNKKDHWIEETMKGLDGLTPPPIPSSLDERILRNLFQNEIKVISIRPQLTWAIAASLVILIAINGFTLMQYNKKQQSDKTSKAYTLYTNYFSYTEQF